MSTLEWPPVVLASQAAFLATVLMIRPVRRWAWRLGCISHPGGARWNTRAVPYLGGVAFFAGFLVPVLVFCPDPMTQLPLLFIAAQMFVVGLYDDVRHLNPATKLALQIVISGEAVLLGHTLGFFSWQPFDVVVTMLWIVGLTNAVNLLDNMDGLAGGVGVIAALYLAFVFRQAGDLNHAVAAVSLAAAVAGFLVYNVQPASIFMGDAGSLFLGCVLALLATGRGEASSVLSLVAVPTLILLIPIFDMTFVTFTRLLRGAPVSQGGRDHTSHRLVMLGLQERDAVLLLCSMATLCGAVAVTIEHVDYSLSLFVIPVLLVAFALFAAYLSQVQIVADKHAAAGAQTFLTPILLALTYKRRMLEVGHDFLVIWLAYYGAYALRFDLRVDALDMGLFLNALPLVVAASYAAFFYFGVYQIVWQHAGMYEMVRLAKAGICAGVLTTVVLFLAYRLEAYSRAVQVLYPFLLVGLLCLSRLSFRLFSLALVGASVEGVPVLIYGAGDRGELLVRQARKDPSLGYKPIGFLDDNPTKQGSIMLGLPVLGGQADIQAVLERTQAQGLIIASPSIAVNGKEEDVRALCRENGVWVRTFRIQFLED